MSSAEPATVTVVFASNARGMLPLSVAAWSVAEHALESTVCDICILSDGIPAARQEELRALYRPMYALTWWRIRRMARRLGTRRGNDCGTAARHH